MRKIVSALMLVAMLPASAGAGSAEDPEIVDARGDAGSLREGVAYDASLDITRAWFEPIRSGETLTGFAINVETAADATEGSGVSVDWVVEGSDCQASVWMMPEQPGTGVGPVRWTRDVGARLDYWCTHEEPSTQAVLDQLRIKIQKRSVPAGLTVTGNRWRTLVPLSAFSEGDSATRYVEGAVLSDVLIYTFEVTGSIGFGVDVAPGCGSWISDGCEDGSARPYRLGD